MNILIIGDIFGECGFNYASLVMREIKEDNNIDLCIANAENVSGGNGMSYADYNALCNIGIDAFTMGNHTFGRKDIIKIFENFKRLLAPIMNLLLFLRLNVIYHLLRGKNSPTMSIVDTSR